MSLIEDLLKQTEEDEQKLSQKRAFLETLKCFNVVDEASAIKYYINSIAQYKNECDQILSIYEERQAAVRKSLNEIFPGLCDRLDNQKALW